MDGLGVAVRWEGLGEWVAGDQLQIGCREYATAFDAVPISAAARKLTLPHLADLRCRYVLKYVRAPGFALAELELPRPYGEGLRPRQNHLSLTEDPTEMKVVYLTGSDENAPTVRYGDAPDALNQNATGTSSTYAAADMCGPPANVTFPTKRAAEQNIRGRSRS